MLFTLHPKLEADCIYLGKLALCRVLLMNDQQYPWLILVPERHNITEIYQLDIKAQQQLIHESSYIAEQLNTHYNADKINIAALGNQVPQLHIHHVVRYKTDKAWPAPIWGAFDAKPYSEQQLSKKVTELEQILTLTKTAVII